MTAPPVGVPRVVEGEELPVLYPGEQASAQFPPDMLQRLVAGERLRPSGWLVEPMPGWHGAYLRWRYRLFWWLGGKPDIRSSVHVQRTREP
jgi:hypothetical protein